MRIVDRPGMLVPLKVWDYPGGVDEKTIQQMVDVCKLPIIFKWAALMPDGHWGMGSAVGAVIPTKGAVIPSTVGVDIGCGMMAVKTTLTSADLPTDLKKVRELIERKVPAGRTNDGRIGDRGSWHSPPPRVDAEWYHSTLRKNGKALKDRYDTICNGRPNLRHDRALNQLGTLGTGNHFLELCLDEAGAVWLMLHSGSRGPGNKIGSTFIKLAGEEIIRRKLVVPEMNLAYLPEDSPLFDEYVEAVEWAQDYAYTNRVIMMHHALDALHYSNLFPKFEAWQEVVNCHHNYISREVHYGENILVTRKGAVRARADDQGIIPGSMGARSYIVHGLGNPESFDSCSHGAGRAMSRTEAKNRFNSKDLARATEGVECLKTAGVVDEIPYAYKDIDAVMEAQKDLVKPIFQLKQFLCIKGEEDAGGWKKKKQDKREKRQAREAIQIELDNSIDET